MQDLDGQVLALLPEHLLLLLLEDQARPMMGVHDLVADLVDGRLPIDVEVLDELLFQHCVADVVPLLRCQAAQSSAPSFSGLQITVHEVDLLQAAKALADVLRTHVAHALHGFQLRVGDGEYLVQPAELADNRLHHHLRQAWDSPEDAVAARRGGMVEGVQLPVVAEKLGQAAEVEQVLVRQSRPSADLSAATPTIVSSSCISIRRPSAPSSTM